MFPYLSGYMVTTVTVTVFSKGKGNTTPIDNYRQ